MFASQFFHFQIATNDISVNVKVGLVKVDFDVTRLCWVSEALVFDFDSRRRNKVNFGFWRKRRLFFAFFGWCCWFDFDHSESLWRFIISDYESLLVFDRVVHHWAFVDHLGFNRPGHIQYNSKVRVRLHINILERELVVECTLVEAARPVYVSRKLHELVGLPFRQHSSQLCFTEVRFGWLICDCSSKSDFYAFMLDIEGYL